jgi:hypothetical protein
MEFVVVIHSLAHFKKKMEKHMHVGGLSSVK